MSLTEGFEGANGEGNVWTWQASQRFSVEAMVCVAVMHVPRTCGKQLSGRNCIVKGIKPENHQDPFAVAVITSAVTVSHVLKKISRFFDGVVQSSAK